MESIKVENRPGYLYFFMGAEPLTMEDVALTQLKVMEEMNTHQSTRVLFEKAGEQRKLTMQDYYAIAENFGKVAKGIKFAVLVSPKLETPEVAFFELAVGSAGNLLRYFTVLSQAEVWLLSD